MNVIGFRKEESAWIRNDIKTNRSGLRTSLESALRVTRSSGALIGGAAGTRGSDVYRMEYERRLGITKTINTTRCRY